MNELPPAADPCVYVATGEPLFLGNSVGAILKSADGGVPGKSYPSIPAFAELLRR